MRMSVTRLLIFYSQTPVAMKNLVLLFLITFSFGAFAYSPADSVYRKDQTLLKHFFEYANKKEIAKLPINEKVDAIFSKRLTWEGHWTSIPKRSWLSTCENLTA